MTLEEIRAAMAAIETAVQAETDGGDAVSDEDLTRYEELANMERRSIRLAGVASTAELRSTPVIPAGIGYVTGARREDDTLDRAFEHYLRTGTENGDLQELRAMGEGTGGAGGFTVPQGFLNRIVDRMKAFGGIASEVDSIYTESGNPIEWPELDDTSNTGDVTAEGTAPASGADLVFTKNTLGAYKYTAAGPSGVPIRVSYELAQDSAFDLAGLISQSLAVRIARKQAAHWATGTGVSQPLGLVAASLTADRDLDTADAIDYEDLVEFQDLLDEAYDPGAKWLMRKNTWSQIRLIVDLNGRPIVQSSVDGISGKPARLLLGAEVRIAEEMPELSSDADTFPIVYGDLREAYVIRRVQAPTVLVNPYTRQSQGEIEYSAWERADGTVKNRNAYKILQNNT